ncbi:MAG: hypothetical protein ACPGEG_10040 [Salibacteraceae bacterium]
MQNLLAISIKNITWGVGLIVILTSCQQENKTRKSDAIDAFLNQDIMTMESEGYTYSKTINFKDNAESQTSSPNWKDELSFLDSYLVNFRRNNDFSESSLTFKGNEGSRVFTSLNGDSLVFRFKNKNPVGFRLTLRSNGVFRESHTQLTYKSLTGYRLVDHNSVLHLFENNIDINSQFIKPNK